MMFQKYTIEKYCDNDTGNLNIVKQENDSILSSSIEIVNDYFRDHPNIKCVYGDIELLPLEQKLYLPSFHILLLQNQDWQPILYVKDINLQNNPMIIVQPIAEIAKHIIQQGTFIHHIPEILNQREIHKE